MGGRINYNPRQNDLLETQRLRGDFYNRVHEVTVTEVNLDQCTVSVRFNVGGDSRIVPMSLMGYSIPPKTTPTDKAYRRASWGVYIPQKGDVLNLAFGVRGDPIIIGYKSFRFGDMQKLDEDYDDVGGVGWGSLSGKRLAPGDWSWKSGRGCQFYLGDRVLLSSGPYGLVLNRVSGYSQLTSDLHIEKYGNVSECRSGSVRRLLLPGVDSEETYIRDPITTLIGQEHSHYVRRMLTPIPGGTLMVRTSLGNIVDDLTNQIVPPSVFSPSTPGLTGTGARILRDVKDDASGKVSMWTEVADNLGNYGVSAPQATAFQWSTPLAAWQVTNLSTKWISTGTYDIVSAGITTITASSVKIGSAAAISPLVKGDMLNQAFSAYTAACSAAFTSMSALSVGPLAAYKPGFDSLVAATSALSGTLAGMLSLKNFTD